MITTVLSVLVCLALTIKLIFFTDQHREESRWVYRAILFVVAVYCGHVVIDFLYHPRVPTNPGWLVLHTGMLIGAFVIKPEYLPRNQPHETSVPAVHTGGRNPPVVRQRIRSEGVYGFQGQARITGERPAEPTVHH